MIELTNSNIVKLNSQLFNMKLSLLNKMFKNEISIEEFKSIVQNEIKQYKEKLRTKGTTIPNPVEEDINLYFQDLI